MVTTTAIKDQELVDLGLRLIGEYVDVPAGSVLRCLARAVVNARSWGCPSEHLVSTAEASTRWLLARRAGPDLEGVRIRPLSYLSPHRGQVRSPPPTSAGR